MTVLITGAAAGIGRAVAEALIAEGRPVIGLDRDAVAPMEGLTALTADLADPEALAGAAAQAIAAAPDLDGVVNCAGIYPVTGLIDLNVAEWDRVLDINLRAPMLLTQALARHWIETGRAASVVNIASTAAILARPGTAHYAASKAGLVQLTRVMAIELATHKIRVNAVAPGLIATERVMEHAKDAGAAEHATKLARIPATREGTPAEIAEAVRWLLSPAAAYCIGSVLTLDGGYTLGIPGYG